MSFFTDIQKFADKTEQAVLMTFRGSALGVMANIIKRTPVGNPELWVYLHPTKGYVDYLSYNDANGYIGGRLRGNWQASLNSPKQGELDTIDKSGTKTTMAASSTSQSAKITDSIYLVNNLPYAARVEDGWSTQAPVGMLKVSIAEFQNIVKANARKAKK